MRSFLMATAVLLAAFALTASAEDATQPTTQSKGTITGKVLHDGKPMPGMRVEVFEGQGRKHERKNKGAEAKGAGGVGKIFGKGNRPSPIAQTVSAADGTFTLEVPEGSYVVVA